MNRLAVIDDVHCVRSAGEVPVNLQRCVATTAQFCCVVYSRHAASNIARQFTIRRYVNVNDNMQNILTVRLHIENSLVLCTWGQK